MSINASNMPSVIICNNVACWATMLPSVNDTASTIVIRARDAGWRWSLDGRSWCPAHTGFMLKNLRQPPRIAGYRITL